MIVASAESDLDSILCYSVGGVVAIHEAQKLWRTKSKQNRKAKKQQHTLACSDVCRLLYQNSVNCFSRGLKVTHAHTHAQRNVENVQNYVSTSLLVACVAMQTKQNNMLERQT